MLSWAVHLHTPLDYYLGLLHKRFSFCLWIPFLSYHSAFFLISVHINLILTGKILAGKRPQWREIMLCN